MSCYELSTVGNLGKIAVVKTTPTIREDDFEHQSVYHPQKSQEALINVEEKKYVHGYLPDFLVLHIFFLYFIN